MTRQSDFKKGKRKMKDKLVIIKGYEKFFDTKDIRVTVATFDKINEVAKRTHLPMKRIVEIFTDFALDHLEIIESAELTIE